MLVAPFVLALALVPAERLADAAPVLIARQRGLKELPFIPVPPPPPVKLGGGRLIGPGLPLAPVMPGSSSTLTSAVGGPGDEAVLTGAKVGTTAEALLDFFRQRTPPAPPREKIDELVKKLASNDLKERDQAQAQLTAIGQAAVPPLRTAANNVDALEASTRARECLANIEGANASNLVIQAARLLASRKPSGAAEVLIGYLPYAEDDNTFQEVEAALVAVAMREGKPDAALIKALKDPLPIRRGTAAQVLCQAGGVAFHGAIRPLLKDSRPSVRFRAALGLVGAYDAEAIPVLIDLLAELQPGLQQQAEEYLTQLAGEWAVSGPRGNDLMSRRLRRDVWAAWWKNTEGAMLLEEFKSRTTSDEELLKITSLIDKLQDDRAEVREQAVSSLIRIGKNAVSPLRRAVNDNHPKIAPLAAQALEAIEKDAPSTMPAAAPRLLGLRKPEGTLETLLSYLPFCESAELAEQLMDILGTVAIHGGKADERLVKALQDRVPVRRACAAVALARGKAYSQIPALRKLLKDPDLMVQLRVAQSMALLSQKEAVPTLINLLKDLPLEQAWDVEDYLGQLAGEKSPNEGITPDAASRDKVVAAWMKWWNENGEKIDLSQAELARRESGLYLVVENWNPARGRGRVMEVDATGKVRWEIPDLQWPYDAQPLRGGTVLVVEQQNRVTERDRKGKIVGFDRYFPSVFHIEKLRDGTMFVACRNQLLLVDAKGSTLMTYPYTTNTILAAKRFRDGTMALLSYGGHYIKLDKKGKELKNVQIPNWGLYSPNGAEIVSGDRIILAESRFNKVLEFGLDGKASWECAVMYPLVPHLMNNGNVIVAGNSNSSIYEIDRKGKIVKEWKGFSFKPYRVLKR